MTWAYCIASEGNEISLFIFCYYFFFLFLLNKKHQCWHFALLCCCFWLLIICVSYSHSDLQYIFKDIGYDKPFFSTYLKTSMFMLYLLGFLFWRPWRRQCLDCFEKPKTLVSTKLKARIALRCLLSSFGALL